MFVKIVSERFVEMSSWELYTTDVPEVFEHFLGAFPEGSNPIFRKRHEWDCNCCKQFVRRLGTLVNIDGKSVWSGLTLPEPFATVASRMANLIEQAPITGIFRTKEHQYGVEYNYDKATNQRFDHFHGVIAPRHRSLHPETAIGEANSTYQVLHRGLKELRDEDFATVLELIDSNELYRGAEFREAVKDFWTLKQIYGNDKMFVWRNLSFRHARFRNTAIGTLFVDLASGMELEEAVKSFEQKVAPMNYKRPTAVITQRMVEQAITTLNELGLGGAIHRRFAKLSDVSVNDVLFVNNDSRSLMKDHVMTLLESSVKKKAPSLVATDEVSMDQFLESILPGANTVELALEGRHLGNFVSLTVGKEDKPLFKWNNNFAWSYDGDVTDSVKQRVKAAGGKIDCLLRVSLSWYNFDDLDLHAMGPGKEHIYFGNKGGILDVDMNAGTGKTRNAVENLAFNQLKDGEYEIWVNQYNRRETIDVGFALELEYQGEVKQYSYSKSLRTGENVACLTLTVKNGRVVGVKSHIIEGESSSEKWGVKTGTLIPVSAVMLSPNHWGSNNIGAKHLIFALEGCKNPNQVRGIYNEFVRGEFEKHRKVLEVLGAKTKCAVADEQISGVGFTSARGDSVVVVIDGRRKVKINF